MVNNDGSDYKQCFRKCYLLFHQRLKVFFFLLNGILTMKLSYIFVYIGKNLKWQLCSKGNKPQREHKETCPNVSVHLYIYQCFSHIKLLSHFYFSSMKDVWLIALKNSCMRNTYSKVFPWRGTECTERFPLFFIYIGVMLLLKVLNFLILIILFENIWMCILSKSTSEFYA